MYYTYNAYYSVFCATDEMRRATRAGMRKPHVCIRVKRNTKPTFPPPTYLFNSLKVLFIFSLATNRDSYNRISHHTPWRLTCNSTPTVRTQFRFHRVIGRGVFDFTSLESAHRSTVENATALEFLVCSASVFALCLLVVISVIVVLCLLVLKPCVFHSFRIVFNNCVCDCVCSFLFLNSTVAFFDCVFWLACLQGPQVDRPTQSSSN